MKTKYFVLMIGIMLIALLLFGCSATTDTPTQVPPTAAPTPINSSDGSEVWDLAYISDSSGMGVANKYAARIEQDMGVQVEVHDLIGGGFSALYILEALRGERNLMTIKYFSVDLVPFIEEAEVIVVYGNSWGSESTEHPFDWNCAIGHDDDPDCLESTSCGEETFAQYEANLAAIYEEIFAIRSGEPVILRTADWYLPWGPLETWRTCGHEQICKQCQLNWSEAIHRVADEYGVPVAGLMEAFSGPNLDREMPREFIRDDVHPSDKGAAAIADVLADLGYEPVAPKSLSDHQP
jgi:hypothetical protein